MSAVNILNLAAFRVTAVEEEAHDYHVRAEIVDPPSRCRECGSDRISPWGAREAVIKDLPIHGKRVGIYVQVRRFRCAGCGKTFSETMPAVAENRRMTDRLVRWIGEQSMRRTFTSIAEETGVVEGTVRNIFRDFVTELEKTVRFEALRAKILFTEGMHKRDRARPKFERRTPERDRPTYGRFSTAALREREVDGPDLRIRDD